MRFDVLGSLRVVTGGVDRVPRAPKQRQLLALLVLGANTDVPVEVCVAELWRDDPPRSWAQTLQTYVMQLRRALGADGAARLVTGDAGYSLHVEPGERDVDVFTDLVGSARLASARGDDRTAASLLRRALGLWRGPALADVAPGPVLRVDLVGLVEARSVAAEQRIEAELRQGRHRALLPELRALVARHPTHENAAAQLMVALHRCGLRSDALAVYDRLSRVLSAEQGLEPSPRMRRLRDGVRSADLRLAASPVQPAVDLQHVPVDV